MTKSRYTIVTVGSVNRDISFYSVGGQVISTPNNLTAQRLLGFEYGAKMTMKDGLFSFGGGAANVATTLALLGYKVGTITRVGKDETGTEILHEFKRVGVDTALVQRDAAVRSGVSFVLSTDRKEREHVIFLYRGANEHLQLQQATLRAAAPDWWYVSSLSGEFWHKNLQLLFAEKKRSGAKLAWNPGSTQLQAGRRALAPYLAETDVLFVNKDEAIELVLSGITLGRRNPKFVTDNTYLLHMLYDWGPKLVVITLGKKGAWAYDGKRVYRQGPVKSKVVDTCGVGDSFGASVIGGLIDSRGDITTALRWGAINSAANVGKEGAQYGLLHRAELQRRLAKLYK
jgi:ribokinase